MEESLIHFESMGTKVRRLIHTSLPLLISCWTRSLGKPKPVGAGQPVVILGDLNAGPWVTPATAKALTCEFFVGLDSAYADGRRENPSPTCLFDLDGASATGRVFFFLSWPSLVRWLPVLLVKCSLTGGSDHTWRSVRGSTWVLGRRQFSSLWRV